MPPQERAVTLECAGNGRLETRPLPIGEPWGDYAVSTARWRGALPPRRPRAGAARAGRRRRAVLGRRPGAYHLNPVLADTDRDDLRFVRALPLALAADPAAEILIAYEMNGEPLRADHGAPFRLIVPHWYAVASVKWLQRIDVLTEPFAGEFQTGHYMYEWPDREHEAVSLMRVRARITAPAARSMIDRGTHTVRGKAWSGTGPVTQVDVSLTGEATGTRRSSSRPPGRTTGRTGRSNGQPTTSAATPSARGRPTQPATPNRRSRPGTASATGTTRSRSSTSTWPDHEHARSGRRRWLSFAAPAGVAQSVRAAES